MATAAQLKTLIKSHYEDKIEQFNTYALQLAAHEAKQGHAKLANDIRKLVDGSKKKNFKIIKFQPELSDLVTISQTQKRINDLIVNSETKQRIARIITEYKQQSKLKKHGLNHRRKILLCGPPGTGKTMTASILSGELHLALYTILMDKMVTKFMGETSAKFRQVFDMIKKTGGVYLFDEFDAIGAERGLVNDVGEMRRVLNTFLQLIEQDDSDGLIIAATNNVKILDQALFRRFDDVIHYQLPNKEEIEMLVGNMLGKFYQKNCKYTTAIKKALALSHGEICGACEDAIKDSILNDEPSVKNEKLEAMINERHAAYGKKD